MVVIPKFWIIFKRAPAHLIWHQRFFLLFSEKAKRAPHHGPPAPVWSRFLFAWPVLRSIAVVIVYRTWLEQSQLSRRVVIWRVVTTVDPAATHHPSASSASCWTGRMFTQHMTSSWSVQCAGQHRKCISARLRYGGRSVSQSPNQCQGFHGIISAVCLDR